MNDQVTTTPTNPKDDPEGQSWQVLFNHDRALMAAVTGVWKYNVAFPLVQLAAVALNKAYPAFACIILEKRSIPVVAACLVHLR